MHAAVRFVFFTTEVVLHVIVASLSLSLSRRIDSLDGRREIGHVGKIVMVMVMVIETQDATATARTMLRLRLEGQLSERHLRTAVCFARQRLRPWGK